MKLKRYMCILFLFCFFFGIIFYSKSGTAFRNVGVGAVLPNMQLHTLEKKSAAILSKKAQVNVFLFFRPNQEYSIDALEILASVCKKGIKGRKVHCVAMASDYYPTNDIKTAVRNAKWVDKLTLIDKDDLYYGTLGASLHPSFGIADSNLKLLAYEPYSQTNYHERIQALVKHALGEINLKQLTEALNPPADDQQNDTTGAQLNLNYAKQLLKAGKLQKALEQANKAIHKDDHLADGFALVGLIYQKQKKCNKAKPAFEKALELDPNHQEAQKGMKHCK